MNYLAAMAAVIALAMTGTAQARPVLVELFTSQACSSCPPADALLASLQQTDRNILPLSFNVTYWNSPAWMDKDSLTGATDRQNWYAALAHSDSIYTPEAVVDGKAQMVGSDRNAVTGAILAARHAQLPDVQVTLAGNGKTVTVALGQSKESNRGADTVWLFGFDPLHSTQIGGGENGGATLTEVNVVRSIHALGSWSGSAGKFQLPRPAGAHLAVIIQRADGDIDGLAAE